MRKIVGKIVFIIAFALMLTVAVEVLSLNDKTAAYVAKIFKCEDYLKEGSGYDSVGQVIQAVGMDDNTDCLVIGDSIAGQFFGTALRGDNVGVHCSNAAICITGQYMLAMNWLDTHENAKDIYLYMHPTSITRSHDTEWSYPYVVIPFWLYNLDRYLDADTVKDMQTVYGSLFMTKPIIRMINNSPLNRKLYLNYLKNNREEFIQKNAFEISERYIVKLKEECDNRGVRFHFMSTPSSDYQKSTIDALFADYSRTKLSELFPDYLSDVYYFSNDYSNDCQHLAPEYATREFMDEIMAKCYSTEDTPFD